MTKPARQSKPQPTVTAKVINLVRPVATITKTNDAGSVVTTDPRSNHFANANGPRWGRNLRSKDHATTPVRAEPGALFH